MDGRPRKAPQEAGGPMSRNLPVRRRPGRWMGFECGAAREVRGCPRVGLSCALVLAAHRAMLCSSAVPPWNPQRAGGRKI